MASGGRVVHPLIDDVRGGTVLSRSTEAIVALHALRADLLQAVAAAGGRLVLVTGAGSRLTEPLRAAIAESGAGWAVERDGGGWYDGRSGRVLTAPEHAGTPAAADNGTADEFLRVDAGASPQLALALSLHHRADESTLLGGALATIAGATGGSPAAWGPHEPLERAWDPAALTGFARAASPQEVRLHVAGYGARPLVGSIQVRRTDRGVEEVLEVVLGAGPPGTGIPAERVAAALTRVARSAGPLFGLVLARAGMPDLTVRPVAQDPASPVAVLVGARAVHDLGIDAAGFAQELGGRVVGRPRLPALLIPVGPDDGWNAVEALVERIGPDRFPGAARPPAGVPDAG